MAGAPEFQSLLFPEAGARPMADAVGEPDWFRDLNLDQVVAAVVAGREGYRLKSFFYGALHTVAAIRYRQAVMRDLDEGPSAVAVRPFAEEMVRSRDAIARAAKASYPQARQRWRLEAAWRYAQAVRGLGIELRAARPSSPGLKAFAQYLAAYLQSPRFRDLWAEVEALTAAFNAMRYEVLVQGLVVQVRPSGREPDFSRDVLQTFERFQPAEGEAYNLRVDTSSELNPIEGRILEKLAELEGQAFARLADFCDAYADFADPLVERFDREAQFYLAWLDYIAPLKAAGLCFCYPVLGDGREVLSRETFDVALAAKLVAEGRPVVPNDLHLRPPERIIVVSGPNQGGKTTFARTFGQLHHLASLGLPVPGREAVLSAPDRVFTHFERGEQMASLRGKLQDDLIRIRDILDQATPRSVVIINELFASTTLKDAILLSRKIAERLVQLAPLCVWVTFIEETASLAPTIVSMASTVDPTDPSIRTFKVIRKAPDGVAHALSIARKYRLTRDEILERLA